MTFSTPLAFVECVLAQVHLVAHGERGEALLDQLQKQTGIYPFKTTDAGERVYALDSTGTDGFAAMLGRLDADWPEHVSRIAYESSASRPPR